MASFATTLKSFIAKVNGDVIDASHINDLQDEMVAVQAKLGVDNSAVTSTIDYKLKNTSSVNPGHKHTISAINDVVVTSPTDGQGLVYQSGNWVNQTTSIADASTSTKGITKVSVAPVSASNPIAVGDNDPRVPTQNENDALVGTSGSPSSTNKFVTDSDGRILSIFGDGSDGDVTISSNTTLTRDMNYNNLTINPTFTLNTSGYRVFVKGTLTNNGTISNNGSAGGNGASPGSGGASGTITGGSVGANGAVVDANNRGGAGGGGGGIVFICAKSIATQGTITASGGAGGNAISNGLGGAVVGNNGIPIAMSYIQSGTAGAAANGATANAYAGGTITASSKISSNVTLLTMSLNIATPIGGGAGGAGGGYTGGAAGGGGGGQGGVIINIYNTLTTSGTLTVSGGSGGTGATGGASGAAGGSGRTINVQVA
jgi:hypothetical protein